VIKKSLVFRGAYLLSVALCGTWILGFFVWMAYQNLLFIENFDFVPVYNNDESVFQGNLNDFRILLREGMYARFFSETVAAYGNIYWSFLTFTTWPFFEIGWYEWVMAWPRMVSLLSYFVCVLLFFSLCRRRNKPLLPTLLAMILITMSASALSAAVVLWTNLPVAAFVFASLYILLLRDEDRSIFWGSLMFGLALGIKVTAVFFLPLFLLALNKDGISELRFVLFKNLKAGVYVFIVALLAYTPTILLYPFGYRDVLRSYSEFFATLAANKVDRSYAASWSENIQGFFEMHLSWPVCVAGLLLAVGLIWRRRKYSEVVVPVFYLLSALAVFLIAQQVKNFSYFVGLYSMPVLFTMPLIFLEAKIAPRFLSWGLLCLIGINFYLNQPHFTHFLTDVHKRFNSEKTQQARRHYQVLQKELKVSHDDKVFYGANMAFPVGRMDYRLHYDFFYGPEDLVNHDLKKFTLFAFDNSLVNWSEECDDISDRNRAKKCYFVDLILKNFSKYEVLYNTKTFFVVRVADPSSTVGQAEDH